MPSTAKKKAAQPDFSSEPGVGAASEDVYVWQGLTLPPKARTAAGCAGLAPLLPSKFTTMEPVSFMHFVHRSQGTVAALTTILGKAAAYTGEQQDGVEDLNVDDLKEPGPVEILEATTCEVQAPAPASATDTRWQLWHSAMRSSTSGADNGNSSAAPAVQGRGSRGGKGGARGRGRVKQPAGTTRKRKTPSVEDTEQEEPVEVVTGAVVSAGAPGGEDAVDAPTLRVSKRQRRQPGWMSASDVLLLPVEETAAAQPVAAELGQELQLIAANHPPQVALQETAVAMDSQPQQQQPSLLPGGSDPAAPTPSLQAQQQQGEIILLPPAQPQQGQLAAGPQQQQQQQVVVRGTLVTSVELASTYQSFPTTAAAGVSGAAVTVSHAAGTLHEDFLGRSSLQTCAETTRLQVQVTSGNSNPAPVAEATAVEAAQAQQVFAAQACFGALACGKDTLHSDRQDLARAIPAVASDAAQGAIEPAVERPTVLRRKAPEETSAVEWQGLYEKYAWVFNRLGVIPPACSHSPGAIATEPACVAAAHDVSDVHKQAQQQASQGLPSAGIQQLQGQEQQSSAPAGQQLQDLDAAGQSAPSTALASEQQVQRELRLVVRDEAGPLCSRASEVRATLVDRWRGKLATALSSLRCFQDYARELGCSEDDMSSILQGQQANTLSVDMGLHMLKAAATQWNKNYKARAAAFEAEQAAAWQQRQAQQQAGGQLQGSTTPPGSQDQLQQQQTRQQQQGPPLSECQQGQEQQAASGQQQQQQAVPLSNASATAAKGTAAMPLGSGAQQSVPARPNGQLQGLPPRPPASRRALRSRHSPHSTQATRPSDQRQQPGLGHKKASDQQQQPGHGEENTQQCDGLPAARQGRVGAARQGGVGAGEAADSSMGHAQMVDWQKEVLVTVVVYAPRRSDSVSDMFMMLGSQPLSMLADKLQCVARNNLASVGQEGSGSSYLFVEGCFYNDVRRPGAVDLSQPIIALCEQQRVVPTHVITKWGGSVMFEPVEAEQPEEPAGGDHAGGSQGGEGAGVGEGARYARRRSISTHVMHETQVQQLTARLANHPNYLFSHLGCCEHLIQIADVRAMHPTDPQLRAAYPLQLLQARAGRASITRRCDICESNLAEHVAYNDPLGVANPTFFCDRCLKLLHPEGMPAGASLFVYAPARQ